MGGQHQPRAARSNPLTPLSTKWRGGRGGEAVSPASYPIGRRSAHGATASNAAAARSTVASS